MPTLPRSKAVTSAAYAAPSNTPAGANAGRATRSDAGSALLRVTIAKMAITSAAASSDTAEASSGGTSASRATQRTALSRRAKRTAQVSAKATPTTRK